MGDCMDANVSITPMPGGLTIRSNWFTSFTITVENAKTMLKRLENMSMRGHFLWATQYGIFRSSEAKALRDALRKHFK